MNSTNDGRFSGVIGDDYDSTFKLICPHVEQLEASVADAIEPIVSAVEASRSVRILDLGCGDGLTAIPVLKRCASVYLTGVDNEPQMLSQFRNNLANSSSRIDVVCQDALGYLRSVQDGFFDGVVSCFVLHNWKDEYRYAVLKELFRVIRSGGVFVNADKLAESRPRHEEVFLKQISLVIDAYTKAKRPDLLREWVLHYLEDNIPGVLWFESEASKQLMSVGFAQVKNIFRCDLEATLVAYKSGEG